MHSHENNPETSAPAQNPENRREFFKKILFYTSAGIAVQAFAKSVVAWADDLKTIDMTGKKRKDADNTESVGTAKGLGYVPNLAAALKAKKIIKAERPGNTAGKVFKPEEQMCQNCQFFNYKKDGKATCQLLQKVLVEPKGSCNSWTPNA